MLGSRNGKLRSRKQQFDHIAHTVAHFQAAGDPVISVDTKKKELIGDFKNAGKEWQPKGVPEKVVPQRRGRDEIVLSGDQKYQ